MAHTGRIHGTARVQPWHNHGRTMALAWGYYGICMVYVAKRGYRAFDICQNISGHTLC